MSSTSFDDLSRELARPTGRRRALKLMGASVGAAVGAVVLKPFRGDAACPTGTITCGTACCASPQSCINFGTSLCGCYSTQATCGSTCCSGEDAFCADAATSRCGCPAGATPCGNACCSAGTACADRSTGKCACAAGSSMCGTRCCKGACSDPATSCCCPSGTTSCGTRCCAAGVACYDKAQGLCGCPAGTQPQRQGNQFVCCKNGTCNPPPAPAKRCRPCSGHFEPCTKNSDCCNNFCIPAKGGTCGCTRDSDCFFCGGGCDAKSGICDC